MIGFEQAMYYLCIYTTRGLFVLFADEETQPGGELVQGRAGGRARAPQPLPSSISSSASGALSVTKGSYYLHYKPVSLLSVFWLFTGGFMKQTRKMTGYFFS